MKLCKKCKITKPIEQFHLSARSRDGHVSNCKTCVIKRSSEWQQRKFKDDDKRFERTLKRHNITLVDYNKMLLEQDGKCYICGTEGKLFIDHDHTCCSKPGSCGKCVRKLLCPGCNNGLGFFKENVLNMSKAIEYVLEHRIGGLS